MIEGFEEYTKPLTELHIKVVIPLVIKEYQWRIGKAKALHNETFRHKLKSNHGIDIGDTTFRRIAAYIRYHGLLKRFVASGDGYWVEPDPEEVRKWLKGYAGRARAIVMVADAVEEQLSMPFDHTPVPPQLDLWPGEHKFKT